MFTTSGAIGVGVGVVAQGRCTVSEDLDMVGALTKAHSAYEVSITNDSGYTLW